MGEKRFSTSFFGFKKSDVNTYIEKMLREFEEKLKERDTEISALISQNKDMKVKYEELLKHDEQLNDLKAKLALVLVKAQEKADQMIENAKVEALDEKKQIEHLIEEEKEKLVDLKEQVRVLKSEIINTLKKYDGQLSNIVEDEEAG